MQLLTNRKAVNISSEIVNLDRKYSTEVSFLPRFDAHKVRASIGHLWTSIEHLNVLRNFWVFKSTRKIVFFHSFVSQSPATIIERWYNFSRENYFRSKLCCIILYNNHMRALPLLRFYWNKKIRPVPEMTAIRNEINNFFSVWNIATLPHIVNTPLSRTLIQTISRHDFVMWNFRQKSERDFLFYPNEDSDLGYSPRKSPWPMEKIFNSYNWFPIIRAPRDKSSVIQNKNACGRFPLNLSFLIILVILSEFQSS